MAGVGSDTFTVNVVHGFLKFCVFGEGVAGPSNAPPNVVIGRDSILDCGVGSKRNLEVERRNVIAGDIISYGSRVDIARESHVTGDVSAPGKITLGNSSLTEGDVASGLHVTVRQNSTIDGDLTSAGEINMGGGVIVTGLTQDFTAVTPLVFALEHLFSIYCCRRARYFGS